MKATIRVAKVKSLDELRRSPASGFETEIAAFEAYKATTGATQRKGAPLALRLSCGILQEQDRTGDTQPDRSAPPPGQLLDQATKWAESWAGPGSVFSARTGTTDGDRAELLVAPVRDSRGKPVISTQKALTELVRKTREQTEYGALQTSWAAWCAAHIDPAIQRGTRRKETSPAKSVPGSFATVREAIRQANLSEDAAERLEALLRLKVELARHRSLGSGYVAPEPALSVSQLHPPAGRPPDPWPFIEAVRAPALAVLKAGMLFGVEQDQDDPEYQGGTRDFPDLEDRIRLAIVMARSALFCAETEARVKNRLYGKTSNHPDTCWPYGARRDLTRHETALTVHLANQIRNRPPRKLRRLNEH